MNKIYLFLLALFATIGVSAADYYIDLKYEKNNWNKNELGPVSGEVTFENQAIGTGSFFIKVWDGSADHCYFTEGKVDVDKAIVLASDYGNNQNGSKNKMYVKDATDGETFTIKFNPATKTITIESNRTEPDPTSEMYFSYGTNGKDWIYGEKMTDNGDGAFYIDCDFNGDTFFIFSDIETKNWSGDKSFATNGYGAESKDQLVGLEDETQANYQKALSFKMASLKDATYRITISADHKFQVRETYYVPDPIDPDDPWADMVNTVVFASSDPTMQYLRVWDSDNEAETKADVTLTPNREENPRAWYYYTKGHQFDRVSLSASADQTDAKVPSYNMEPDHGYILYLKDSSKDAHKFITNLMVKIIHTVGDPTYIDFHHILLSEQNEGLYSSDTYVFNAGDKIESIVDRQKKEIYPLKGSTTRSGEPIYFGEKGEGQNSFGPLFSDGTKYFVRLDVPNMELTFISQNDTVNNTQEGYLFIHYGFGDGSDHNNWNYTRRLGCDDDIFDCIDPIRVPETQTVFFGFTKSTRMFPWAADNEDTYCPGTPTAAEAWLSSDPTRVESTVEKGPEASYYYFTAVPNHAYRVYATLAEGGSLVRYFVIDTDESGDDDTGYLIDAVQMTVAELDPVNQTIQSCYIPAIPSLPGWSEENPVKELKANPSHTMKYTWVKYSNEDISYDYDWKYYQCDTYISPYRTDVMDKVIYYYKNVAPAKDRRDLTYDDIVNRPWAVHMNNTATHDCRNFDDVYYRFYGELDDVPVITKPVETNSKLRSIIKPDNQKLDARVAYAVRVGSNTSGIEGVTIDGDKGVGKVEFDGVPEYFNLNGIKVTRPQAGQIYIVRRGSVVTKEVIR